LEGEEGGCSTQLAAVAQGTAHLAQPLRNPAGCQAQTPLMKKVKEA